MTVPFSRRWTLVGLLLAAIFAMLYAGGALDKVVDRLLGKAPERHVYDEAGLLSEQDRGKFEEYLAWVRKESDVDLRFVFLKDAGGQSLEQLAAERLTRLGVGGRGGNARGALLLYDPASRRLRIEVGYGLEGVLPDSFVAYLMRDHASAYFAHGDLSLGLRLLVRLIHQRIREAVLGRVFDPRVLDLMGRAGWLSGGAGGTAVLPSGQPYLGGELDDAQRRRFGPQPTPEAAYRAYLAWLAEGKKDADIGLLTPDSRAFVAALPLSRAYFEFILMQEYGRAHRVDERGDKAMVYFTDDPLVSPHFFVKDADGWRLDLTAEVRDTRNRVGGVYAWDMRQSGDPYLQAFSDRWGKLHGYWRIKGGDNRELPLAGK
ncbi:MAG: TPM domain-containing protein [Sulfuricellaceae bacterium]|jgi:hypothetical protein